MLANLYRVLMDHGLARPLFRLVSSLPLSWQKKLGLEPVRIRVR